MTWRLKRGPGKWANLSKSQDMLLSLDRSLPCLGTVGSLLRLVPDPSEVSATLGKSYRGGGDESWYLSFSWGLSSAHHKEQAGDS